ncbi:hypothetical protein KCV87_31750 [Actinosynnema pretiosum subsp. pretiosum]|uniref:Uncharacterized protein n=2 Tax=Actinosynnema TaxID=40566 RepID=C6WN44_ACTMD|nr:DUF6232 family protein [Actinosynnema mirum]ACU38557.1 hypothetical protein Amir_4727 [Actinosynnema mirum DSM 43827]AXX32152.1 hypothetical protein APASM_4787 [Actinosynnema pretiosum subsp. pretiosum]QUF03886.1 hypothetical protein KCV87_31750 [Actinosynnema pretiosum subsp. pretiosum]
MSSGEIRIGRGILRVGGQVYPLRNISSVSSCWGDPQPLRGLAVKKALLRSVVAVFLSLLVGGYSAAGGVILFVVTMALVLWRASVEHEVSPIYGLVLNTAGVDKCAIWSFQESEIDNLVEVIAEAIGDPDAAQAVINLDDVVDGDVVRQFGGDSIGKQDGVGVGGLR